MIIGKEAFRYDSLRDDSSELNFPFLNIFLFQTWTF